MKRAKSLFNQIVSFDNLRLAWLKARKGKTSKPAVKNFSRNVNENLQSIQKRMCASPPQLSTYVQFKINDPKERIISVVPFADRVIHHAIINVLEPIFERQFIYHSYACRKGKGTHSAARYAFTCAKKYPYFLKLDVRKYFDSIDHTVLKRLLCKIIKDGKCLELLFSVIDSYESSLFNSNENSFKRGLPIGNLTSQFFANFYLSTLDHYILENIKPCGYVRYMDDMVLFSDSVEKLQVLLGDVEQFCKNELHLLLKTPSFGKCSNGVPFLGWRITNHGLFILSKTKQRMNKKLMCISNDFKCGKTSEEKACVRACCVYSSRKL